ncbi:GNAT family N-acetyltransferase [Oceanobacillus sp. J11TS1]|uniref:GNAT family N-acetyltransferase n=1 Tax=Oceanobacillus sp. J11TS1 TaxID=2807191 RepID=UPI001B0E8B39|nr:GNAT family N-acetyltransferase [Oceanobacillus sp. J11TS1]GIO21435.1 N-acetyltransferase [Oceanobacillus sp. J11TS1]
MIRKLTKADHAKVMELVEPKAAENLFIIGDIEAFGYDSDVQEVWGQWKQDNLIAVLLRYRENFIVYSEGDYDVKGFAEIINKYKQRCNLSGLKHLINPLLKYIDKIIRVHKETYYAACEELRYPVNPERLEQVEYLKASDYEENIKMLQSIPEFSSSNLTKESREDAEKNKTGRTYFIRDENGTMVASASTTAENSQSAMIVGVGTRPGYERQGYATKCMEKLCTDLLAEGKSLCLFYDNPAAGNIYKRLGFEDIGMWTMIRYEAE